MTKEELAALLNGSPYPFDVPTNLHRAAKDAGLVVVFGASDDLMEFRGAIYDELGAWDGTAAYLNRFGLLASDCNDDDCPYFADRKSKASTIKACWNDGSGYAWSYETTIPHATFEVLDDDGSHYCRGIVFALGDVP